MNTKKMLAVICAAVMCAGLGACGQTEDEDSQVTTTTTAAQTTDDAAPGEDSDTQDYAGESDREDDIMGGDGSADEKGGDDSGKPAPDGEDEVFSEDYVINGHFILNLGVYGGEEAPEISELRPILDSVIDQYNAAYSKDEEAFWKAMNLKSIATEDILTKYLNEDFWNGEYDDHEALSEVLFSVAISGLNVMDTEIDDEEFISDSYAKNLAQVMQSLDAQSAEPMFEYTIWEDADEYSEDYPQGSIPLDPVIYVELDNYEKLDGVIYAEMDIEIITGEYGYNFNEVYGWSIVGEDGGSGAFVSDVMVDKTADLDENMAGMNSDQIMEYAKKLLTGEEKTDNDRLREANGNAKTLYTAAAEYFADRETEGKGDYQKVIDNGDFQEACSSSGLDLSETSHPAAGDQFIAGNSVVTEGIAYMGLTDYLGDETFFIQYQAPDGTIGQYPAPLQNRQAMEKVEIGTFYSEEDYN